MNEVINNKGEVFFESEGYLRSLNIETGYGFLVSIDEDKDIYLHYTQFIGDFKQLKPGDRIKFLYKKHNKGLRAFQASKI